MGESSPPADEVATWFPEQESFFAALKKKKGPRGAVDAETSPAIRNWARARRKRRRSG